ncbi:hypothetical protein [Embleya sp. NPDC020886]|uniref:hypothetical protein n=1 Tax=Embleya sp. NPDC020886 TaxID=3363980 RepID=UPI00378CDC6D
MRRICTAAALAITALTLGSAATAHADRPGPSVLDRVTNLDPANLGHMVDGPTQKATGIVTSSNAQP